MLNNIVIDHHQNFGDVRQNTDKIVLENYKGTRNIQIM